MTLVTLGLGAAIAPKAAISLRVVVGADQAVVKVLADVGWPMNRESPNCGMLPTENQVASSPVY